LEGKGRPGFFLRAFAGAFLVGAFFAIFFAGAFFAGAFLAGAFFAIFFAGAFFAALLEAFFTAFFNGFLGTPRTLCRLARQYQLRHEESCA